MSYELVTAATFSDAAEAEVARVSLEGQGIPAVLSGEIATTTFAGLTGIAGNVQLRVRPKDLERAVEILQASSAAVGDRNRPTWKCSACDTDVDADMEVCPKCGALAEGEPEEELPAEGEQAENEAAPSRTWVADRLAQRAFRAAVIGLFIFPPLGHFYSLWVLLRVREHPGGLSDAGWRYVYAAAIIDALVLSIPLVCLSPLCCGGLPGR